MKWKLLAENFLSFLFRSISFPRKIFLKGKRPLVYVLAKLCWSYIGYTKFTQDLSLQAPSCVHKGINVHDLLHALGIFHEQSRADRDKYVTFATSFLTANYMIQYFELNYSLYLGLEHNFDKQPTDSLGVKYDPKSVMHYSSWAFSNGNGPTILWKKSLSLFFGSNDLSELDIIQLNKLYYCNNIPIPTPTTTTTIIPTTTTTTTRPTTTTTTTRPTTTTTKTKPATTTKTTTTPTTFTTATPRPATTTTTTRPTKTAKTTTTARPTTTTTTTTTKPKTTTTTTRSKTTTTTTRPTTTAATTNRPTTTSRTTKTTSELSQGGKDFIIAILSENYRVKKKCPRTCCERGELYKKPQ
ncbi:zinc metalloproteinase nas-14-like [Hydractinia symbiolongicarpus]|uniref:zinc metalloproteinase nas-14-like n=1 Tax=Hydractinia symbiolongicarpus TaxID=13093 RepID=UPI00254E795A|nr:zinc metalloproteinase nas-14-like [Hydractinia symbiolongicarpus]